MKKITNIINRCLLVLLTTSGIAMYFFMNHVTHLSFVPEIMSASIILLTAFLYFVLGVFYPENREDATGIKKRIFVFMEQLSGAVYGNRANGSREKYVGPRQCRRYWDPTVGAILIVLYAMFGAFVLGIGESSPIFVGLWIGGCVLIVLIMIVSVFWKYEDIREITGESHPWIAAESIFIVFGIFAIASLVGYGQYRYELSRSPFHVDVDKIKEDVEQAENAAWEYKMDESDYMQMSQVIEQIKESYGDSKIYYKISDEGMSVDPNGVSCEKVSFIVTGESKKEIVVFEYYKYEGKGYVMNQSWQSDAIDRDTLIEKSDGTF